MSAIPPNWMSSIIGGHAAQRNAEARKKAEQVEQAARTSNADFQQSLDNVIEGGDRDTEVYEDAEGRGGQGSPFSAPEDDQPDAEEPSGEDRSAGLDLQA